MEVPEILPRLLQRPDTDVSGESVEKDENMPAGRACMGIHHRRIQITEASLDTVRTKGVKEASLDSVRKHMG